MPPKRKARVTAKQPPSKRLNTREELISELAATNRQQIKEKPFQLLNLPTNVRKVIYHELISEIKGSQDHVEVFAQHNGLEIYSEAKRHHNFLTAWELLENFKDVRRPSKHFLDIVRNDYWLKIKCWINGPESWLGEDVKPLSMILKLARSCRKVYREIMAILAEKVVLRGWSISSACWYGATNPLFASQLKRVIIASDLFVSQVDARSAFRRLLLQLVRLYPTLERLEMPRVATHRHDSIGHDSIGIPDRWYDPRDLEQMQFVLEHSAMRFIEVCSEHEPWDGLDEVIIIFRSRKGREKYSIEGEGYQPLNLAIEIAKQSSPCKKENCLWRQRQSPTIDGLESVDPALSDNGTCGDVESEEVEQVVIEID